MSADTQFLWPSSRNGGSPSTPTGNPLSASKRAIKSAAEASALAKEGTLYEVGLSFGAVRYTVRRSARAKRLSLRYDAHQGFEVVLPQRMPLREVEPFVRGMEPWILRTISAHRRPPAPPFPTGLYDGARVPYLGTTLAFQVAWVTGDRSTIQLDDTTRTLQARLGSDAPLPLEDLVEIWYRYAAKTILPERVERFTMMLGVSHGRIAIKDARTRWASCSSKGNLNFSWRLLLTPEEVLDYVVAHEVAHLVELNHSPRFWATLAGISPDFKRHQEWMKRHGPALMLWPRE